MAVFQFSRRELSQYKRFKVSVMELDERIQDVKDELSELDKCTMNISPVYTGMPSGNEKRDKVGDFVIGVIENRKRLETVMESLVTERNALKFEMYKIWTAINQIPNKPLRDIARWHFIDGQSVSDIADQHFMTINAIQKRLNRLFRCGSEYTKL